jgi:hypothetical protein
MFIWMRTEDQGTIVERAIRIYKRGQSGYTREGNQDIQERAIRIYKTGQSGYTREGNQDIQERARTTHQYIEIRDSG